MSSRTESKPQSDDELLRARLKAAMALVDVTCRLAVQHDVDEVLHTVTNSVCPALNCERASLFLLDEERGELYTRVVTELEIREIRVPVGTGVAGWVAEHARLVNIPDPPADRRWLPKFDRETGFTTRNILCVPLISAHDRRLIGVLQLLNNHGGPFDEIDEKLAQAFASHAAIAVERSRLLEEARRSQELQLAIDMGRSIQSSFLPSSLPRIPGYEVAAWWHPAESVSGDYYDLFDLPDGRLALVVADVSGHGVGPSLIMASARAMLHVLSKTSSDPQQILSLLADSIVPDLQDGRFITFLIVALDPARNEITYANAGHGPALHLRRSMQSFETLVSTGLPVGFGELYPAEGARRMELEAGDLVVLATDGAIELRDADDRMFGRERLEALIRAHCAEPADQLLATIRRELRAFMPGEHPPDDITILILERKLRPPG